MSRKTFNVAEFTKQINTALAMSDASVDHRRGLIFAVDRVLHDAGAYKGFRYLTANEVPVGQQPGINISPIDGQHVEDFDARFADTDRTRVSYFL